MAFLFGSSPGVVGLSVVGDSLPFAVVVGGAYGVPVFAEASVSKAILTGFKVRGEGGLGVRHTLREKIYVYVYGERAGTVDVSGLAFPALCAPGGATGLDYTLTYYEQTRVSTTGVPVRLVLGPGPGSTLFGFMKGFSFNLEDPSTGVGSFAFEFTWMPRVV